MSCQLVVSPGEHVPDWLVRAKSTPSKRRSDPGICSVETTGVYNPAVHTAKLEEQVASVIATGGDDIVAVYLYGSVARGSDTSSSDVDLAVLYRTAPPRTLEGQPFGLEAALERLIGRDVQVIVLNDAPVDLVHRVLRDGRVLVERDRAARIRFEVRARNEYFDLAPILERYRKAVLRRR